MVPAGALARAAIVDNGCRTIKVKIGTSLADDEARVVAVRDALDSTGADGRIRLDVNGMWSLDQARTSLRRLGRYGIEYVEQPCRDLNDVARLRAEIDIPIAIDEGIRLAGDPTTVRLQGIADYAICKPMTLGGAVATGRVAGAVGVPVVISGSLDSSIGLASCVATAASLPELSLNLQGPGKPPKAGAFRFNSCTKRNNCVRVTAAILQVLLEHLCGQVLLVFVLA